MKRITSLHPGSAAIICLLLLAVCRSAISPISAHADTIASPPEHSPNQALLTISKAPKALPNLAPYTPGGWSGPLVISAQTDTHTDSAVRAGETAYLDYAYQLQGADTAGIFYNALYLDDTLLGKNPGPASMSAGAYGMASDAAVQLLTPGPHVFKLIIDSEDTIAESDETDNVITKTVVVQDADTPDQPNLKPTQPDGWDAALVVSSGTGTHSDSLLRAGSTVYLDYALLNDSLADIDTGFRVTVLINSTQLFSDTISSLAGGAAATQEDKSFVFTLPGTYTLKLVIDANAGIAESDETDNSLIKEYEVLDADAQGPNLRPFLFPGQANYFVVSNVPDTDLSTTITAGETVYIDYAYTNDGDIDIAGTVESVLAVDGIPIRTGLRNGLAAGGIVAAYDVEHMFPTPGTYTLSLICDNRDVVSELSESDNTAELALSVLDPGNQATSEYTGWYYDPEHPGTGFSMEIQGDILFLVWYAYASDGDPVWYAAWASQEAGLYAGDLRSYTGSGLEEEWTGASYSTVGEITISFSDTDNALITWTLDGPPTRNGSVSVEKYMPSLSQGSPDPRALDGWYYDPDYPGMGFFLEARGETLYLGWYHYRTDTSPRWWVMGGWMDPGGFPADAVTYVNPLQEYVGGTVPGDDFTAPMQTAGGGPGRIDFALGGSAPTAGFTHNGNTYSLIRYTFSAVPD